MMSRTKFLCVLCVGLIVMSSFSQPKAIAQVTDPKQQQRINDSLKEVASLLVSPLTDSKFRSLIREELKTARNPGQKVPLEATLQKIRPPGDVPAAAGSWEGKMNNALLALKDAVAGDVPSGAAEPTPVAITLSFPAKGHLQNWDGGADLLVAYAPLDDSDASVSLIARSVKYGYEVALDPETPPETPTLIVGLGEPAEQPAPPLTELAGFALPPGEENPIVPDANDTNSYIGVRWVMILDDHEPWYKGDPEVYVKVTQWRNGVDIKHTVDLPGVNKEFKWYDLGDGVGYPSGPAHTKFLFR